MVRTKSKIYAETVHPDTLTAATEITVDQFVVGKGLTEIEGFNPGPNAILISNGDGTINVLSFNGQANKVIGTDDDGNIVLLEMVS